MNKKSNRNSLIKANSVNKTPRKGILKGSIIKRKLNIIKSIPK